jgi:steroid delta-isomerase-like uncharacterized protein
MERRRTLARPFLAVLALIAAGLGVRRYRANREADGRRSSMLDTNKEIARRLLTEVFGEGRLETADELVSAGHVGYDAAMPEPILGAEGVKQAAGGYRAAFPDVTMSIEDQIAEGDRVVTRWIARGSHGGEFFGIQPTGKQVTVTGTTINRIRDGKVVEAWTNWDTLGLLQQLGAVLEPIRA